MKTLDLTLEKYLSNWYSNHRYMIKPSTYETHLIYIKIISRFDIAAVRVCELDEDDMCKFVSDMVEDGLAQSTIRVILSTIRNPLTNEYERGRIDNPFRGVKIPPQSCVKKPKRKIEPYTADEQERLIRVLRATSHDAAAAIILMLENRYARRRITGVRTRRCRLWKQHCPH